MRLCDVWVVWHVSMFPLSMCTFMKSAVCGSSDIYIYIYIAPKPMVLCIYFLVTINEIGVMSGRDSRTDRLASFLLEPNRTSVSPDEKRAVCEPELSENREGHASTPSVPEI